MRRDLMAAVVMAGVLVVAACTGPAPEPVPSSGSPEPSASSAPSGSPSPDDDVVVVETLYGDVPLRIAVHPVQRFEDVALVRVDWTVPDDSPRDTSLNLGSIMSGVKSGTLEQLRLVDLERSWVSWPHLVDGSVTTSRVDAVGRGETVSSELLFAAPPGDEVDLLLPLFGYVTDVPVMDVEEDEVRPQDFEVAPGDVPRSAPLESFIVAFDETATASAEGAETTVALASDVLFATDEFVLTAEAAARVDEVAGRIKEAAQEGEVVVVGHTDDVGSDAYNLDLSVKRAESVAARLGPALGSGFSVRTEGKGESEPVAEGTSSEARAANRRVEIRFAALVPGAPVDLSSVPVPDAVGVVGSGHETVVVENIDVERYEVSVRRVEARSGYLIGTIEIVRRSETGVARIPLLANGRDLLLSRGYGGLTWVAGAASVRLAGQGSWIYPVDYQIETTDSGNVRRSVLADRVVVDPFNEADMPVVATVTWPDTGQDAVTVDVVGRFRITDVPVEGRS